MHTHLPGLPYGNPLSYGAAQEVSGSTDTAVVANPRLGWFCLQAMLL